MCKLNDGVGVDVVSPESEGMTVVKVNDGYNFLKADGKLLSEEDFKFASMFVGGKAAVQRANGLWNYIKPDGSFVSPDKDFEAVDIFVGPVGHVYENGKWLTIDKDGNIAA